MARKKTEPKSKTPEEKMIDEIRRSISRCEASEKETYEALVVEAEGWKMRLEELEAEEEDNGDE